MTGQGLLASGKDANEQARVLWDSYAPRYDQHIRVSERLLFPDGRSWGYPPYHRSVPLVSRRTNP